MDFVLIKDFIEQYHKDNKSVKDCKHPLLLVWKSFRFCDCECPMNRTDMLPSLATLEKHVHQISINRRALKQVDYNYKPCYYVNDYYFTLKENPDEIFALYTNILLSEWIRGKWHRGIDTVTQRLLCLSDADILGDRITYESLDDYIILDTYDDFKIEGSYVEVDEYYDEDTLDFPDCIAQAKECTNEIALEVAKALGFHYDTDLMSGK